MPFKNGAFLLRGTVSSVFILALAACLGPYKPESTANSQEICLLGQPEIIITPAFYNEVGKLAKAEAERRGMRLLTIDYGNHQVVEDGVSQMCSMAHFYR